MPKAGITKIGAKSTKLIHPQSRKANKLGAREIHKERVKKVHRDTSLKNSILREKLLWFKDALDPDKKNYSKADAERLVEIYLERFEEELEQIAIINSMKSRSRQHASREDIIIGTKSREEGQFSGPGIEIPDIIDGRNLKIFRAWDGNLRYMGNIKLRKLVRTVEKGSNSSTSNPLQTALQAPTTSRERDPEERNDDRDSDDSSDEGVENDTDSNLEDGRVETGGGLPDEGVEKSELRHSGLTQKYDEQE